MVISSLRLTSCALRWKNEYTHTFFPSLIGTYYHDNKSRGIQVLVKCIFHVILSTFATQDSQIICISKLFRIKFVGGRLCKH